MADLKKELEKVQQERERILKATTEAITMLQ